MTTLQYRIDIYKTTEPDLEGFDLYINGEHKGFGTDLKDTLEQLQDILNRNEKKQKRKAIEKAGD